MGLHLVERHVMQVKHLHFGQQQSLKKYGPIMPNCTKRWHFLDALAFFAMILTVPYSKIDNSTYFSTNWAINEFRRWKQMFRLKRLIFRQFSRSSFTNIVVRSFGFNSSTTCILTEFTLKVFLKIVHVGFQGIVENSGKWNDWWISSRRLPMDWSIDKLLTTVDYVKMG